MAQSILMVQGKPRRPRKGLCIGSQLAAGGASLVAAWAEELALRQESERVKKEVKEKCFIRRWLDDLWLVNSCRISSETRNFILFMQHPHFYGTNFTLKRVRDGESFGFSVLLRKDGTATTRCRMGFIQEKRKRPGLGWQPDRSTFHGGCQYQSAAVQKAVLCGHITWYLDLSSEKEEELVLGVARILVEVRRVGTDQKLLSSVIRKMPFSSQPALKAALPVSR